MTYNAKCKVIIEMGFIYVLTSPKGKKYIGQTFKAINVNKNIIIM